MLKSKMLAVAIGAAALLGLSSAGAAPVAAPSPPPETPADVTPRPFGWFTGRLQDGRAQLGYGEEDSDNVAIVFECRPGEGALHASSVGLEGEGDANHPEGGRFTSRFSMQSGAARGMFPGQASMHEETGPMLEDARIILTHPVIVAFGRTGQLSVGPNPINSETPAELARIRAFLAICRGR